MNAKRPMDSGRMHIGHLPAFFRPGRTWGWVLVLGALLLAVTGAQAQTIKTPWITFQQEDGLVSNNVLSLLADQGVVWFGTDVGVSRFDGAWESFTPQEGMAPGRVQTLAHGSNPGEVWAGTDRGHVARWDGAAWQQEVTVLGSVNSLLHFNGQLWMGSSQGLFAWNGRDQIAIPELRGVPVYALAEKANALLVGTGQGLWVYQGQSWSAITQQDGLPSDDVRSLWVAENGTIWAGTMAGLAWQDPSSGKWVEIPAEDDQGNPFRVITLAGDAEGVIWGGTNGNGALKVTTQGIQAIFSGDFSGDQGLTTPYVRAIAVDPDQSVWFGTAAGVFRYDAKAWASEWRDDLNYPGINHITALLSEPGQILWIGTKGGLIFKQGIGFGGTERIFTVDSEGSRLPSNAITALAQDKEEAIWVGTDAGLARYQAEKWSQPIPEQALPSLRVNALLPDHKGIWIGTEAGLSRYLIPSGEMSQVDIVDGKNVRALAFDSLGRLWVGTADSGIFVQEASGQWLTLRHDPESQDTLPGDAIVALAPDPNIAGGMWVAVEQKGLSHWTGQGWNHYNSASGLPTNRLYTLYTDPADGSLWIGSEGGLTHFDGLTWETLSIQDILPQAPIYAITRTFEEGYWFGSKAGTIYYRPERTPPWIRVASASGLVRDQATGILEVESDKSVTLSIVAGDLHTAATDLKVLYRLSSPGELGDWQPINGRLLTLDNFPAEGSYSVEFQARDQAFNYSDIEKFSFQVVPPPVTLNLPYLGEIRRDLFIWMMALFVIMMGSFFVMGTEHMQRRKRAREAISRGYNPFVSGEPVRREDMFFGRHDLLQRIVDTLHNNSIMIHGERRIGKTTLLYQLANRLREVDDPEYWFIPLFIDLEGTTEDAFFHFLMEEILHGIMTLPDADESLSDSLHELLYYRLPPEQYTDREFSRDLREIIKLLQEYGEIHYPGKYLRIILLMDEMDVMSGYDALIQQRLRRIFMRDFAATLGAVVAGIQISKEWDRIESPWYNLFNEIELTPFNREQAMELLTAPVEGYYRYDPAALEFIIEQSEGRPFRLQQYAMEAVNHMLAENRQTITLDDVEFAHEHIRNVGNDHNVGLDIPTPNGNGAHLREEAELEKHLA